MASGWENKMGNSRRCALASYGCLQRAGPYQNKQGRQGPQGKTSVVAGVLVKQIRIWRVQSVDSNGREQNM